ncbi:hypothetical protein [uncultured Tenacibaculum sp.]|uniref:DUF6896 domain-containing protein n=1 Tax=uncultured Tenacibaculum sp. TaxID=174713 RepID=UPI00262C3AFC|nr:hypothetical protein [uncultured Tenacibaculum sp.]
MNFLNKILEWKNKIKRLYSNSLSQRDIEHVALKLEEATKKYRFICEKLIEKFESKYNFSFENNEQSFSLIEDTLKNDDYELSKEWRYHFHGEDVRFYNHKTEQIVEVNLKYNGYYGVLDFWFFQEFLKTTNEFKTLSKLFYNNTPKLVQVLNYLRDKEKLEKVHSTFYELGEEDKFIWEKNK